MTVIERAMEKTISDKRSDYFAWVIEQDCSYIDGYYIGFQPEKYLFYDSEKKMPAVD